jgi:6 kDa early secretory antigenic target
MDIKVDFGSLSGLADDISSQAATLSSTLDSLKQRLAPAIAQWEGSSGGAYQASQQKWDQSAEDLQNVLAQIGTAVRAANDSFQQGEQQNANRWG